MIDKRTDNMLQSKYRWRYDNFFLFMGIVLFLYGVFVSLNNDFVTVEGYNWTAILSSILLYGVSLGCFYRSLPERANDKTSTANDRRTD